MYPRLVSQILKSFYFNMPEPPCSANFSLLILNEVVKFPLTSLKAWATG